MDHLLRDFNEQLTKKLTCVREFHCKFIRHNFEIKNDISHIYLRTLSAKKKFDIQAIR